MAQHHRSQQRGGEAEQGNHHPQAALAGFIGQHRNQINPQQGGDERQNGQETHRGHIATGQVFQNGRQPQGVTIVTGLVEKVQQDQLHQPFVTEHVSQRCVTDRLGSAASLTFACQLGDQIFALTGRQPARLLRPIADQQPPDGQHHQ
ncbi:hypothetical protein D3C73_1080070 [compost metagenome]